MVKMGYFYREIKDWRTTMTYEEREKRLCNNCEAKENCSYISRNLERKCSFKETTMYGWELGYKDAVAKACEWLNNFYNEETHSYLVKEDIDAFRKAMEEQQ